MEATTTTMGTAGEAAIPETVTPADESVSGSAPLATALKGVGWFSLGLAALAVEGTGRLIKAATQKGRDVAPSVAKPLKTAEDKVEGALGDVGARLRGVGRAVGKGAGAVEHAMDERIAAAVQQAEAPVLAEIGDLRGRIEDLTKKIESLQSRRGKQEDSH
jgi:polyhydroxyalkanoate synthesis regulator phasin